MRTPFSKTKLMPSLEKILVIGNGGRENALAWALSRSKNIKEVLVAPGNGGTENHHLCRRLELQPSETKEIVQACISKQIDLIVIGPEVPLANGLADKLRKEGFSVFGPGADGAKIEASKNWAKELMREAGIPTARSWTAKNKDQALKVLKAVNQPLVIKADGLASGKGVTVCKTIEESYNAIQEALEGKFGEAGSKLVLEEVLEGPEVSIFALCDGERFIVLPTAQDHKRLLDGDKGPNTGGMGAYSPAKIINDKDLELIKQIILTPTLKELQKRHINYRGVLYAGLMLTKKGPKVIEFNCRFGDPECQALMPLMGAELALILQACANGCLEKAPELSIKKLVSACVVVASSGYPEKPIQGDPITINCKENDFIQIFHAGTTINSKGQLLTSGGRVLSIVAQGKSHDEAFNLAYKKLQEINFKGMQFRKDIGNQVRTINLTL